MKDRWPKGSKTGKITSPKPQTCNLECVADLRQNCKWNNNLIYSLFSEKDRKLIMETPLSWYGKQDRYT